MAEKEAVCLVASYFRFEFGIGQNETKPADRGRYWTTILWAVFLLLDILSLGLKSKAVFNRNSLLLLLLLPTTQRPLSFHLFSTRRLVSLQTSPSVLIICTTSLLSDVEAKEAAASYRLLIASARSVYHFPLFLCVYLLVVVRVLVCPWASVVRESAPFQYLAKGLRRRAFQKPYYIMSWSSPPSHWARGKRRRFENSTTFNIMCRWKRKTDWRGGGSCITK